MPYPPFPTISYSYTNFQQEQQSAPFPGTNLDADLQKLATSDTAIINFVKSAIRSDGRLNNGIVTADSLADGLVVGLPAPVDWATGTDYTTTSTVWFGTQVYRCLVDHTSGVFATDLAAGKWTLGVDLSGKQDASANLTTLTGATIGATGLNLLATATEAAAIAVIGLGTAALKNTGASGDAVPLLNVANTFSAKQTFQASAVGTTALEVSLSEDSAAQGPFLDISRSNATPAANDILGLVRFLGMGSGGTSTAYAAFRAAIVDTTDTSEDGRLDFLTRQAGTLTRGAYLQAGFVVGTPTGLDKGLGTLNAVTLYANGTDISTLYKAVNADSGFTFNTTATTQDFMPAGTFGGTWKAAHVFQNNTAVNPFTGSRSSGAFVHISGGTGSNNPNSDHALFAVAAKTNVQGTEVGEVGAFRALCFQNKKGDGSAALFGAYKEEGDGLAGEGGLTTIETSVRGVIGGPGGTPTRWMNNIIGFLPNPLSAWNGRDTIGFYSEQHSGAGFANFLGITDGSEVGVGTMTYLLAGFSQRLLSSKYFSVAADTGSIDSNGNIEFRPGSDVTPTANGDVVFQLTSNTQFTIKARGSDGIVRGVNLTLA